MKRIIDEKGKLFGKINIIDFLVILFLICIMSMLVFGYALFNRTKTYQQILTLPKIASFNFYCAFDGLTPETIQLISVGDRNIEEGRTLGEILFLSKPLDDISDIELDTGKIITHREQSLKKLFAKVRLLGEIKDNAFYYKEEKITIGSKILFSTNKYKVKGRIESIVDTAEEEIKPSGPKPALPGLKLSPRLESVELKINLKALDQNTLKLISVGDIFLDDAGNKLGEILTIGEPSIYTYSVDLGGGNIISRQDPNRKQVLIKATLLGEIKENAFYYRGEKITLGSKVYFITDKYRVDGLVESEPKPALRQKFLLKIKFKNSIPEIPQLINVGDEEKDKEGNTICKVKAIISNEPSKAVVQIDGKLGITDHPVDRDIVLLIEATCNQYNDELFFKDKIVKVGNDILLRTEKYDINGTIIEINKGQNQ